MFRRQGERRSPGLLTAKGLYGRVCEKSRPAFGSASRHGCVYLFAQQFREGDGRLFRASKKSGNVNVYIRPGRPRIGRIGVMRINARRRWSNGAVFGQDFQMISNSLLSIIQRFLDSFTGGETAGKIGNRNTKTRVRAFMYGDRIFHAFNPACFNIFATVPAGIVLLKSGACLLAISTRTARRNLANGRNFSLGQNDAAFWLAPRNVPMRRLDSRERELSGGP